MTFDVVGFREIDMFPRPDTAILVATFCRNCKRVAEAINEFPKHLADEVLSELKTAADVTRTFAGVRVFPARPKPEVPQYVSPEVERAFLQGERNRLRGDLDAAGAMYRKALDVATKQKAPGIKGMLHARLKGMSAAGMLTPEIADWADHIRLLGNDASHEPDEPTKEETNSLANLTRMALIYLFEMPERIRLMRAEAPVTE